MGERTTQGRFGTGNTAAKRHGLYSLLGTGRLPKGCHGVRRALARLRRELEAQERTRNGAGNGELTARQRALIGDALQAERRRLLAEWYMTTASDAGQLGPDQAAAFLRLAESAWEARRRAERALSERLGNGDPFAALLGGQGFAWDRVGGQGTLLDGPNAAAATGTRQKAAGAIPEPVDGAALVGLFAGGDDRGTDLADK
jgi:hypothetical protein